MSAGTAGGNGGPPDEKARVPGREPMTPPLPRRFYAAAGVARRDSGAYAIELDGKPVRTPGKHELAVAARPLAEAIAAEWDAQGTHIDPGTMPLTRMLNTALDGVTGNEAAVRDDILAFCGSDLVCYRAETPHELVAGQAMAWDPVLGWAERRLGARFRSVTGLMPIEQPPEAIDRVAAHLQGLGALQLTALHVMTTLTGSALIALAHADGAFDAGAAWRFAHVDEDWQIAQWGADAEASARRDRRWRDMTAASRLFALASGT